MTTASAPERDPASQRPLRRDAARNRVLILQTAAAVFAEHGLDASYDEIARRAGVGVGTVYRRFPQRDELVRALFESRIEEIVQFAQQASRHGDAWTGLVWFLERTLERQVADRGLKEVILGTLSADDHHRVGRDRLGPLVADLLERAHREGSVRAEIGGTDLGVMLMAVSRLTTPGEPELWRRYFALVLDGLRARPDQPVLPLGAPDEAVLVELG